MQQFIQPCNQEALKRAMEAVSGVEGAKLILAAYGLLDQAMKFGYDVGIAEGAELRRGAAEEYVEALRRAEQDACDEGCADARYDFHLFPDDEFDYLEPKENAQVEGTIWE